MTRLGAPVRRMSDGSPMSDSQSPTSSLYSYKSQGTSSPAARSPTASPVGFGSSSSTGRGGERGQPKSQSPARQLFSSVGVGSPRRRGSPASPSSTSSSSAGFGSSAPRFFDKSQDLGPLRGRSGSSASMSKVPSPLGKPSSVSRSVLLSERARLRGKEATTRGGAGNAASLSRRGVMRVPEGGRSSSPSPAAAPPPSSSSGTITYHPVPAAKPSLSDSYHRHYRPQAVPGSARGVRNRSLMRGQLPVTSSPKAPAASSGSPPAAVPTSSRNPAASAEMLDTFLKIEAEVKAMGLKEEEKKMEMLPAAPEMLPVSHPAPESRHGGDLLSSSQESVEPATEPGDRRRVQAAASSSPASGAKPPPEAKPCQAAAPWKPAGVLSYSVRSSLESPPPKSPPRLLRRSVESPKSSSSSPRALMMRKSIESAPFRQYESRREETAPGDSPLRKSSSSSTTNCNRVRTSSVVRSPNLEAAAEPETAEQVLEAMPALSLGEHAATEAGEEGSEDKPSVTALCHDFPKSVSRYGPKPGGAPSGGGEHPPDLKHQDRGCCAETSLSEDEKMPGPELCATPRDVQQEYAAQRSAEKGALASRPVDTSLDQDAVPPTLQKRGALASRPVAASLEGHAGAGGALWTVASLEGPKAIGSEIPLPENDRVTQEDIGWMDSMRTSQAGRTSITEEDMPVHIGEALRTSSELPSDVDKKSAVAEAEEIEEIVPSNLGGTKDMRETSLAHKIQEVHVYTSGSSPVQMELSSALHFSKEAGSAGTRYAVQPLHSIVAKEQKAVKRSGLAESIRVSAVSAAAGLVTNVLLRLVLKDSNNFSTSDPGIRPSQYRDTFDTFLESKWRTQS